MSSLGMRHPEEGQLLRYLDGELPGEARQIRKHLEACWHCRAELEELKRTVGDCVRYRKNVRDLPAAAARAMAGPVAGFRSHRRFAGRRIAGGAPGQSPCSCPSGCPWAVTGAIAMAVVCAVVYQLRETPSVQRPNC